MSNIEVILGILTVSYALPGTQSLVRYHDQKSSPLVCLAQRESPEEAGALFEISVAYCDCFFSWFSSVSPGKLGHDRFLSNPFLFNIHPWSFHPTLHNPSC
jgi:hypothetical protein